MNSAAPLPGSVGTAYLHQFTAGPLDLLFAVADGTLPPGLLLTPQGFLAGVPTTAGTFGPATICATSVLFPPACQVVTIVITRRAVDLLVAPSPGGPVATPLRATATLVGSMTPTGTLTFRLFFDSSCTNEVFVSEKVPALYGAATSDDYLPPVPGQYRWTVAYSGDPNNQPVSSLCNAAGPVVIKGPATPTVTTTSTSTTSTSTTSTTTPTTSTSTTSTTTSTTVLAPTGSRYIPLSPARIEDTRTGAGGLTSALGAGATVAVQVAGRGGVPSDASAVVMNVTVTGPTAGGYLTLYPDGSPRPLAANVNFGPGKTVPTLAVVKLGPGGRVAMFNSDGDTHVIYDVAGYFVGGAGAGGYYQPLTQARIADTRFGIGGVRLGPGQSLDLQVTGQAGAPAAGVGAAVLTVAATGATDASYLTIYPTGEAMPVAANLTFTAGETVSNSAMVKLGVDGKVTIYNNAGETDVVVDIAGTFSDASATGAAGGYTALEPARIVNTRIGPPLPAGSAVEVQVTGQGGVPGTGVRAVILSVAVTEPAGPGSLTLFPTGSAQPFTADLTYAAGETRSNLVVAQVGADGRVTVATSSDTHVVADVAGWFG